MPQRRNVERFAFCRSERVDLDKRTINRFRATIDGRSTVSEKLHTRLGYEVVRQFRRDAIFDKINKFIGGQKMSDQYRFNVGESSEVDHFLAASIL